MTDKKRPSTRKMKDYENEKIEMASEFGVHHGSNAEVNAKIASQGEAKNSKKTRCKQHNLNNQMKNQPHEQV